MGYLDNLKAKLCIEQNQPGSQPSDISHQPNKPALYPYYKGLYVNNLDSFTGPQCISTIFISDWKNKLKTTDNIIDTIELNRLVNFVNTYQYNTLTFNYFKTIMAYAYNTNDINSYNKTLDSLSYVFGYLKKYCNTLDESGRYSSPRIVVILNSNYLNNNLYFDISGNNTNNIDFIFNQFNSLIDGINLECEYLNSSGPDNGCKDFASWSQNFSTVHATVRKYNKTFEAYLDRIHDADKYQAIEMIKYLDRILFAVYPSVDYPFQTDLYNFFDYGSWQFFVPFGNANMSFKFVPIFETTDFPPDYFKLSISNHKTTDYGFQKFSSYFYNNNLWKQTWGNRDNFNLLGYQWFNYTDLYCAIYSSKKSLTNNLLQKKRGLYRVC